MGRLTPNYARSCSKNGSSSASIDVIGGVPGRHAGELLVRSCGRGVRKMLGRWAGGPLVRFTVVSGSGGGGTRFLPEEQADPVLSGVEVVGVVSVTISEHKTGHRVEL